MIEKLTRKPVYDRTGRYCMGEEYPDKHEIINKINEIIDYLNKKEVKNE